ncbi:MAG: hypothetical protein C4523_17940 [Myxococcales bacterium]|nr:MAG: hypothetical protein C4523_17940 [Myxococcales bacterium]
MVLILIAPIVSATVLWKMSVDDLARAAESVVRGEVTDVRTDKDQQSGRIYTYNAIQVREWIKGKTPETIVLRQIGGAYDGLEMRIPGTPRLAKGDDVVLFLKSDGQYHFLRGMGQGLFAVTAENGVETAVQKLEGAAVLAPDAAGKQAVQEGQPLKLPLAELKAKIRAALDSSR